MVAGHPLSPVDPTPFTKNRAETLRDEVIVSAKHFHVLDTDPHRFSLAVQNDVLAFFVRYAPWIKVLLPRTLIAFAYLRRAQPDHWQTLAQAAHFQPFGRLMRPTCLDPVIRPARETLPVWANHILLGDFLSHVQQLPDGSIDLICTSPPYAEARKNDYDSVPEWRYPKWTVEWMRHAKRVLSPTGSVVIVLAPNIKRGAERPYVLYMRQQLIEDGWSPAGTFAWVKPDAPALGRVDRPRSAWEPVHWFAQSTRPYCNAKATGRFSHRLGLRTNKGSGRHIHHKIAAPVTSGIARATNVLHVPLRSNDMSPHNIHPAQYPVPLAENLIRMLCPLGGMVLDPFMGSGSTAIAALRAGRHFVGFEKEPHYHQYAVGRVRRFRRLDRLALAAATI